MDLENMKKGICTLKLENLKKVYNADGKEDKSLLRATFSILDFNVSENKQVVSKDVCLRSAHTLKFKPLLCQYKETTDYKNPDDDFGTHGEYEGKLRNGEDYILTNTHAIGVSEKEGYLGVIKDEDGNDLDVLLADFVLWVCRYPNEISLINEFYEKGESLYSSCEYYYYSSEVKTDDNNNKYEEITSDIIFDGHCCLGKNIPPAYNSSKLISFNTKWNKAINQLSNINNQNNTEENNTNKVNNKSENSINNSDLIIENNQMEGDNLADKKKMFKKICELSFEDIRSQIYNKLQETLSENEYYNSYITECFDTYFILSYCNESDHKYFKVSYTKENDEIVIDWINKAEVLLYQEYREIPEVQSLLNDKDKELSEATEKVTNLEKELNSKEEIIKSLNEKVESTNMEKEEIENKFNDVTNKLTSLNSMVEEMKPIVDEYNKEQYNKSLNEMKCIYEKKFKSVNALEKFESEEVQELIKKALNENEDGKNAITSLNKMVVDLITFDEEIDIEARPIKELCSKQEKLIPNDSFEARYGF